MALFNDPGKQKVDRGQIGDAATGDILYDGAGKINSNFDAIYNAFGDQRLYNLGVEVNAQKIHGTGYAQKVSQTDLRTPVPMGSYLDVDCSSGTANPILDIGKPGESVVFVNSNGSISVSTPLSINPSGGSFVGVSGALVITQPYTRVECWCIDNTNNIPIWDYQLTSMFGEKSIPLEGTYPVPAAGTLKIPMFHMSEYNAVKLFLTGMTADGIRQRSSEAHILVDTRLRNVYDTEYAVIKIGNANEDDEIIIIKYEIDASGIVNMIVSANYPNIRLAVKTISTNKVGSA